MRVANHGRSWVCLAFGACLLGQIDAAGAAPAGDDWGLERGASDPALVGQRFTKLRKDPFDAAQWRALEAAIGRAGLAKKITEALARDPEDVALGILDARAKLGQGDARAAAQRLLALEGRAGGLRARVLDLRVRALQTAGETALAIAALEAAAAAAKGEAKGKLLQSAYGLADQSQRGADALRLAEALAAHAPGQAANLRLARAAGRAGQPAMMDAAYAVAVAAAKEGERPGLRAEWARGRLVAGDPGGAAELMWGVLEGPGDAATREAAWSLVLEAANRQGASEALIAKIEKYLATHAKDAAGWRTLARAQTAAGGDPVDAWRKALAADPGDPDARAALIGALEAGGESDAALPEFRGLGPRNPERVQLGLDLAGRLIANGRRAQGLQIAAELEAAAGKGQNTLLRLLDFYNLNDEPDRALVVAQRLVKAHPRDPDARIALGEQLFQMGREADAMREWAVLPGLIRPAHAGWARHAEILSEHRRPEAGQSLERALKAAPKDPKFLRLRALIEQDDRVPQRALATWQQIFELTRAPEHRLLHDEARTRIVDLLVGGSLSPFMSKRQELEKAALANLEQAKDMALALESGLLLAELYTREEKFAKAVGVHERLVRIKPQDPERLAELALALRRSGRGDAAMATLEQLMALDPKRSADVLAELAELAFDTGDIERVLAAAARSEGAGPEHSRVLVRLGELYERRGELDEAAKTYEGILQRDPKDATARLRLAELSLSRGQVREAETELRGLLSDGGPPEVIEQAGRRALDLAEASGQALVVLDLTLLRIRREPTDDAARELLLDTLDRCTLAEVQAWLKDPAAKAGTTRVASLRRALVEALTRGAVGARLRAAEHLGRLALPQTAVPLARMGAQLTPPRDATRTVREAFEQARAAAIRSAGELDDPEAVAVFGDLLATSDPSRESWYAAAWSLARSSAKEAGGHLRKFAVPEQQEGLIGTLACAALARSGTPGSAGDLPRVSRLATQASHPQQRRVCALAEAALTPDAEVTRLYERLQAADPAIAAIAAWRLGQTSQGARPQGLMVALMRRYLGVPGLARDAAASALARQLATDAGPLSLLPLPQVRKGGWEITVDRWLTGVTAPAYEPLAPEVLAPYRAELGQALAAAEAGTRAEAQAAQARLGGSGCPSAREGGAADPGCLDLRPLIREDAGERSAAPSRRPDPAPAAAKPRRTR